MQKANEDEERVVRIRSDISEDAETLTKMNPDIEDIRHKIKQVEAKIVESGGIDYKKKKEEVERMYQKVNEVEK